MNRDDFERAILREHAAEFGNAPTTRRIGLDGDYVYTVVRLAWRVWQAACRHCADGDIVTQLPGAATFDTRVRDLIADAKAQGVTIRIDSAHGVMTPHIHKNS